MKVPNDLPFGVVVWLDACQFENPVTMNDLANRHRPEVVTTVGWIMKEDEVGVTIANEFYDDAYRGVSFIHRPMIQSVTHLKLVIPRQSKPKRSRFEELAP